MSCQIHLTANIQDIPQIKRCLFPQDDYRGSDGWLQLCEISASPTGDIIALAHDRRVVILSSKWDSNSGLSQFLITYSGTIHEYDKVKSILCLPIVGQTQSSHVGPDWTCILIGYDSGYIRFYTENCEFLFEEQLHIECITSIKCQSQHNPRPDISSDLHPEEIYIQYQSNICVLNGLQVFPHLRNCRSQLARVQARKTSPDAPTTTLTSRKWGFQEQNVINDAVVAGLNLCGTFDHLLTASTCGGFKTKYRAMAPHNTLVLAAGSKPFVGYHFALEGGAQPVFSDVAKAVATKLKSALPSWLTGNKTPTEKQMTVAMQPAEAMGCRFGLCDLRRTATNIILSPDHKLAAVSDSLGRVLLVDAFKGIVLRIFKGYRDVECSFIQIPDERKSKHKIGNRVAMFLVIYSSKKGTVEIFTAQQAAKICTFTASKFSRLLYINYGLMGFTTTSKSRYVCQFTTIFIDNDGQVKEILIPFHFALAEKHNKRARDIHLYKKLRQLIKCCEFEDELILSEAYNTCIELKTLEIKTQTAEMLLANKQVPIEAILKCLDYFKADENADLVLLAGNASAVLRLYLHVTSVEGAQCEVKKVELCETDLSKLEKLLELCENLNNDKKNEIKVKFCDGQDFSVVDFLSVFDLTCNSAAIHLKVNLDESQLFKASQLIFEPYVLNCKILDDQFLHQSKIFVKDLFFLLINYWVNRSIYLNKNVNLEKEMSNFYAIITMLVKLATKEDVAVDYNEISKFWGDVREILRNSTQPFPALIAAILCKKAELEMEESDELDENIEIFTQENVQWTLLIGKLEDVSLLNIILSRKPQTNFENLPKLTHVDLEVSLRFILQKGRGSISELVAKWLSQSGVEPKNLDLELENEKVLQDLSLLREQFPYSLETSAVLANLSWEYAVAWQKDIEHLELLEASLKCLLCIKNTNIKRGLCNLLWNTHFRMLYESACKLINKVGKLPKERLCRQDTSLSDHSVSLFCSITANFLDKFLDVLQETPTISDELNFEPIWENCTKQPLVELALQQQDLNSSLLHLHFQLSLVIQMITTLGVKHSKPLNHLFDSASTSTFFCDFQKKVEIVWNKSDLKLNASRTDFLFKIISVSLETVTINDNNQVYSMQHVYWMAKCLVLARFWNLNVDLFKRYQVVQLFTNGFDSFAEELLTAINEVNLLGVGLLAVAAKRLAHFMSSSPGLSANISALSPALTQFMDGLDDEWCAPCSLSSITNVASHALRSLSESQSEFKLAQLLLDACLTLEEIQL